MSKRVVGAVLLVFGAVLGAIDAVIAFKPVEDYWGQNCGSVLAPSIPAATSATTCPGSMEPFIFLAWVLLLVSVTALVVGAVLTALPSSRTEASEGAAARASTAGIGDQLDKLHSLRISGVLTDEEFIAAKARLIAAPSPAPSSTALDQRREQ